MRYRPTKALVWSYTAAVGTTTSTALGDIAGVPFPPRGALTVRVRDLLQRSVHCFQAVDGYLDARGHNGRVAS